MLCRAAAWQSGFPYANTHRDPEWLIVCLKLFTGSLSWQTLSSFEFKSLIQKVGSYKLIMQKRLDGWTFFLYFQMFTMYSLPLREAAPGSHSPTPLRRQTAPAWCQSRKRFGGASRAGRTRWLRHTHSTHDFKLSR